MQDRSDFPVEVLGREDQQPGNGGWILAADGLQLGQIAAGMIIFHRAAHEGRDHFAPAQGNAAFDDKGDRNHRGHQECNDKKYVHVVFGAGRFCMNRPAD